MSEKFSIVHIYLNINTSHITRFEDFKVTVVQIPTVAFEQKIAYIM
jgi:hypothetical protein